MAKAQEQEESDEMDVEEIEDEPEIETTVINVDVDAAAEKIEYMLGEGWTLDDHIVAQPRMILIFSREKE
jgi:hypothetical protein